MNKRRSKLFRQTDDRDELAGATTFCSKSQNFKNTESLENVALSVEIY